MEYKNNKIYYIYGTKENHIHLIILEKTLYRCLKKRYPICIAGSGFPYESESDEEKESEIGEKIRLSSKFKTNDVVLTESNRALNEHKVKLFDEIYS